MEEKENPFAEGLAEGIANFLVGGLFALILTTILVITHKCSLDMAIPAFLIATVVFSFFEEIIFVGVILFIIYMIAG